MAKYDLPNVSIDVVPVYIDDSGQLVVLTGKRLYEPFINSDALPGVLLTPQERLTEAAQRALTSKVGLDATAASEATLVQFATFDNPDRDPRGATVSIAFIAVLPKGTKVDDDAVKANNLVNVVDRTITLPFDHNSIVAAAAETLAEKIFVDRTITRALFGEVFTTSEVKGVYTQLDTATSGDIRVDFSNLTRQLKGSAWIEQSADQTSSISFSTGRGRPSVNWTWV